jgi:hypothetical protein
MSFFKIFFRKEQIITARHKKLRPGTNSYGQAHMVTACGVPLCRAYLERTQRSNPLHSPDVSATRLCGGLDTTLHVTSKQFKFGIILYM